MRYPTPGDFALIRKRLQWVQESGDSPYLSDADLDYAMGNISDACAHQRAIIHNGFFIMFDVGSDWFSPKLRLYEKLVLKLDLSAKARNVPAYLEVLAELLGCEAVVAGDALAGKMTPFYERAGWEHLGTTLTKEITNVRRQGG